jgi:hypothetical protein
MPTPYSPAGGRVKPSLAHSRAKNLWGIWISTPAPSPVSGIAAAGAAMRQVDQNLDALDDDVVRPLALEVGNEADSAGIVLLARVVEALRWG